MKILFPIGSFYPAQSGGPSNTIHWHVQALRKKKINSVVVATDRDITTRPINEWIKTDYFDVIYVKSRFQKFGLTHIRKCLSQSRKADIIHLTSFFYPPSFLSALWTLLTKKTKIVWSVRGEFFESALQSGRFRKRILLSLIKPFRHKVLFHATSKEEVSCIKKVYGVDAVLIPNLIELPKRVAKKTDASKYFLFLGRINPIKAIDHLIKGLAESNDFIQSNIKLLIAGKGDKEYTQELKNLVTQNNLEKKIDFLGLVEGDAKQELIANASFLILPSHSENFGNVVVESLAQATPVIASHGTPWEILEKENAGFWIKNSPQQIAEVINQAIQLTENEYQKMSDNASTLVKEKFDIATNIETWIQTYKSILTKTK